jgi:hypothetical protein
LAFHLSQLLLFAQHGTHHVPAHARADLFEFAQGEFRRARLATGQAVNAGDDQIALGAARGFDLAEAIGEFAVSRLQGCRSRDRQDEPSSAMHGTSRRARRTV